MPGKVYVATVADLPREVRFADKYERTGLVMDQALLSFVWLKPGVFADCMNSDGTPPTHRHPFDQTVYVVEGEFLYYAGGKEYLLKAGDVIYTPRDVEHGGVPAGESNVRLIEVFAPIRTDYLYVAEHQLGYKEAPRNPDGSRRDTRTVSEQQADLGDSVPLPPR